MTGHASMMHEMLLTHRPHDQVARVYRIQVGHEDYVVAIACFPPQSSAAYPDGAFLTGTPEAAQR